MSLKEIAKLTGTSVATVSRVLNHPEHRCNEAGLSEKIWNIATRLNYIPNTTARDLRLGTTPESTPFKVDIFLTRFDSMEKDTFFLELFHNIKRELLMNGCVLGEILNSIDIMDLVSVSTDSKQPPYVTPPHQINKETQYAMTFIPHKDNTGLLILGKCPSKIIPILRKRYYCIVGIDRNPTNYEYDEVVCNGTTAAEKAIEYLISLGHKNIAYIGDCTYESRYIGYYQTLLSHKLPLNHTNVYPTNQTQEEGYSTMLSILQTEERPTAIFCANDTTALGVLKALKQSKKKRYIPSVISIDNIAASQRTSPMLTTIDIPKKEMAHLALALLLDRKNKYHEENVRIELPCKLIERDSCTYYYG